MANPNVNLSLAPGSYELISRDDAAAAGLLRYFTGVPCKRGHIAQRYVSTSSCMQCLRRTVVSKWGDNYLDPKRVEALHMVLLVPKGKTLDELEAFMTLVTDQANDVAKLMGWEEGPRDILRRNTGKDVIPFRVNRLPGRRYNNT